MKLSIYIYLDAPSWILWSLSDGTLGLLNSWGAGGSELHVHKGGLSKS